jgi:hypothetical protein
MPDVALVSEAIRRFTRIRIALIGQFPVTMNGLIAAPLQFSADRSLTGAGNAFDQIVPPAHSGAVLHAPGERSRHAELAGSRWDLLAEVCALRRVLDRGVDVGQTVPARGDSRGRRADHDRDLLAFL